MAATEVPRPPEVPAEAQWWVSGTGASGWSWATLNGKVVTTVWNGVYEIHTVVNTGFVDYGQFVGLSADPWGATGGSDTIRFSGASQGTLTMRLNGSSGAVMLSLPILPIELSVGLSMWNGTQFRDLQVKYWDEDLQAFQVPLSIKLWDAANALWVP